MPAGDGLPVRGGMWISTVRRYNGEPTTAPVLDHSAPPARCRAWRRRKG